MSERDSRKKSVKKNEPHRSHTTHTSYSAAAECSQQWQCVPLSDVAELNPRRFTIPAQDDELVSFVPMKSVEEETGKLVATATKTWSEVKKGYTAFQDGDVVFAKITPCMENGKYAFAENLYNGRAAGSTELHVFRPSSKLDGHYLLNFLFSSDVRKSARMNMRGAAGQLRVPAQFFATLQIPLPPLPEQHRIVAEIEKQFSRLDEGVAALKRVQANLKRYRAAVLKAACEGKLVPTEATLARTAGRQFESGAKMLANVNSVETTKTVPRRAGRLWGAGHVPDLTDEERRTLPRGWTWTKVRDLGFDPESTVQVGPMSMKSEDFSTTGIPVLNVGCIQWGRFAESKLDHLPIGKASAFERYRIKPGDVLFTRSGTVGRCAVAQPHQDGWLMTFHLLRARSNPHKCIPSFLRIVFEGAPHIRRQTKAASVGSTRAGFNTNLLANLAVPLPPLAEQKRIVEEVERRLSVIDELESVVSANLQRAARLRQAVLQTAFGSSSDCINTGKENV